MVFPDILWAQRSNATDAEKNIIYMTVAVPNLQKFDADVTATSFKFTGTNDSYEFASEFEFFDEIDVENSHRRQNGQGLFFVLRKKNPQEEFWPRLTKDKVRKPYIKTDFDKWVDEDEQEEKPEVDVGGDMEGLGGMGGMPGMPGMGGMGGPGGFDMSQLLGGMGGAGGAGDFDMAKLQAMASQFGGAGGDEDETSSTLAQADEELPEEDENATVE